MTAGSVTPNQTRRKKKKKKRTFTILILGLSGSGKSTFAKQMKILYGGGFSDTEKESFTRILRTNTVVGLQELIQYCQKLDIDLSKENRKRARFFLQMNASDDWNDDIVDKLRSLWNDPTIQQAWQRSTEYQMQVSMIDHHVQNMDRYMAEGFTPTNEDLLRARQRTTGFSETVVEVERTEWRILDCGGQKPERVKWEGILGENSVNAIIFFAALDEYNMVSSEEAGKTKMQLAMESFKEVISSDNAKGKSIILFLNKKDLFDTKFKANVKEFHSAFPKFGSSTDIKEATDFIGNQFRAIRNECSKTPEDLFVHVTCALDTEAMGTVFTAVCETLFTNGMMKGYGGGDFM